MIRAFHDLQAKHQGEDGFSSDSDELMQQKPEPEIQKQQQQDNAYQDIKQKVEQPQQIITKIYKLGNLCSYSRWSLKKQLPKPIPLLFEHCFIDGLVSKAIKSMTFKSRLVYLGPRQDTTLLAWHNKNFASPYHHLTVPILPKYSRRQFCGQKRGLPLDTLIFDSHFESGNLDAAFKINSHHYELFVRVDSNTRGHIQWFNFKVKNVRKDEEYKFSLCNFSKRTTLYTRGCKPYFFSKKKYVEQNIGWHQSGEMISYQQVASRTSRIYEIESNHYMLTFTFKPEYDSDEIQICYSIPYTYSQLNNFLQTLIQKEKLKFVKMMKLCTSLGGLEVPLVIINETNNQLSGKQHCIIVSGRAHPGESNGSYMMEGFIQFICGNSKTAKYLRSKIIFKIIPMLNPDGVAIGNHRTGLSGKDFNREFSAPNKHISPQAHALKKLVNENKALYDDRLLMFLDFHGHSVKKNVFMYGPQFPISSRYYYESRLFPKLLSDTTKLFRYYSCVFRISQLKESTARVVVMKKIQIPFSYTIEASNGSYYDPQELKEKPFTIQKWKQMGFKLCEALQIYCEGVFEKQKNRLQKTMKKNKQFKAKNKHSHHTRQSHHSHHHQGHNDPIEHQKKQTQSEYQSLFIFEHSVEDIQIKQLKQYEAKKQENLISDDQLSESSSDQQGEQQNLHHARQHQLEKIISNKEDATNTTYNSKLIQSFLDGKKEPNNNKRQPIWMRNLSEMKEKNLKKAHLSFSNPDRQIFKKKDQKGNPVAPEIRKEKTKASRVISFGTGIVSFDSKQVFQEGQNADQLYQQILKKKNSTFYIKAGFLPGKKRQILDNCGLRKTQNILQSSLQRQKISKANSYILNRNHDYRGYLHEYQQKQLYKMGPTKSNRQPSKKYIESFTARR